MFIFPIEWSLLAHFKTRYAMLANVGPSVVRLCTIHRLLSVPWSSPFLSLRGRMCPFHIPVLRPHAGPMHDLRGGTSVVLRDTIRLA